MAPAYKLSYFNVRGLAEPIRFLFSYAGIEFEDDRFVRENWPKIKESMPFGHVPALEYQGRKVGQHVAIARYVAKQCKLTGDNDWEDLEIDAIVDTLNDLRIKMIEIAHEKDEGRKAVRLDEALKETLPYYLSRLDMLVESNGGYLATLRLTWADLYFAAISQIIDLVTGKNVIEEYAHLESLRQSVFNIPKIKKWIEQRPNTEF